jgi:hypothetical protein
VTSVKFTNPNGSPALAARNEDGSPTEWLMTPDRANKARHGAGPARILETGANALYAETRSNRDEIKVQFLPTRAGSPPGFLKTVIIPDGRVIPISAGNPNE